MPKAADVFERAGIAARMFPDPVSSAELEREWYRSPADLLITGTSHQTPFESALWDIARQHECPSLAMLDQWCNLPLRFRSGRPEYVGALDVAQADDLMAMGFPRKNVLIVGHPWLTDLMERRGSYSSVVKTQEDRDAVCVLFVSENIADSVASGRDVPFGFDEIDSFTVLYDAACAAAGIGTNVSLAVKFHPYEEPTRFREHLETLTPPPPVRIACVPDGADSRAWVLWSDLVVGISSMLLFEAMVLGRPVVSVQPGLIRENTFAPGVNGYARTLTDRMDALSLMTRLIRDPGERRTVLEGHGTFTTSLERDCVEPVLRWMRTVTA